MPDLACVPAGQDFVAVGADLEPGTLLAGYRAGVFPMPEADLLGWWSPDPRGILLPSRVRVSRSLRRALRRFTVSADLAFAEVVLSCADPARPHGWITREFAASYGRLHELGWAHSIEVWDHAGALAGGLFGVEVGGLFAAESKFHRASDASKVAVVALAELLAADGRPDRVIDVQWRTEHLAALGVVAVPRTTYMRLLGAALGAPAALARGSSGVAEPGGPTLIRWRRA